MNENSETYEYKGFKVKHYPVPKHRPVIEHQFYVYRGQERIFSLIKGISGEARIIFQAPSPGSDALMIKTGEDEMLEAGKKRIQEIIDSKEFEKFPIGHEFEEIQLA